MTTVIGTRKQSDDAVGMQPARALPLLFLGTAHVSLALAFLFAGCWPGAVAGFFYHPWLVALVHLVTLGWLTFSIVGAFYIVGPLALRMEMSQRRMDYAAYAMCLVGLVGMAGHFWFEEYVGMACSAAAIASGIVYMTVRIVVNVKRARIQRAIKVHIILACLNFWIAASMGLLLAFDKFLHFLPGYVLANVFAHAHLAALGWVTMMIVGVGYRLFAMMFPSKMPSGRSLYATALLLETGVVGLFVTLLRRSASSVAFAAIVVTALAVFLGHIVVMRRRLVPKPVAAPRLDFGLLHAAAAGVSLLAATALGMALLIMPPSAQMLHAAAAYGVVALVGFLAQMVVAMETRLLPMATWFWANAATGCRVPPISPYAMRDRSLQAITFAGWTIGVPALASGMFLESAGLVALGAWTLFAAVLVGGIDNVFVIVPGVYPAFFTKLPSRPAKTTAHAMRAT